MQENYERLNVRDTGNTGGRRSIPVAAREEVLNNKLPKMKMNVPDMNVQSNYQNTKLLNDRSTIGTGNGDGYGRVGGYDKGHMGRGDG